MSLFQLDTKAEVQITLQEPILDTVKPIFEEEYERLSTDEVIPRLTEQEKKRLFSNLLDCIVDYFSGFTVTDRFSLENRILQFTKRTSKENGIITFQRESLLEPLDTSKENYLQTFQDQLKIVYRNGSVSVLLSYTKGRQSL